MCTSHQKKGGEGYNKTAHERDDSRVIQPPRCYQNLGKRNELGAKDALSEGYTTFWPALYTTSKGIQNGEYGHHVVFGFKDMNNIVKVLKDVMKPEVHAHYLYSNVPSASWCDTPV